MQDWHLLQDFTRTMNMCWGIISDRQLAYLEENWKNPSVFRSLTTAKWVSWHEDQGLRGKWRVSWQCVWAVQCAIDHADWWLLTMSYRRNRVGTACWNSPPQSIWSVSQEDVRSHRTAHAARVAHQQKPLSTVKRSCPYADWRADWSLRLVLATAHPL